MLLLGGRIGASAVLSQRRSGRVKTTGRRERAQSIPKSVMSANMASYVPPRDQSSLTLERADRWALDSLVKAARALFEDEGARAPTAHAMKLQLHRRLSIGARAWLFRISERTAPIAFALCGPAGSRVRIEQFRVEEDVRRCGHGQRCIEALLAGPLASAAIVEVRVLEDNVPARAFWRSAGFRSEDEDATTRLRMTVQSRPPSS